LVELMTGKPAGELFPKIDVKPGEVVLSVQGVSTGAGSIRDVSLEVRCGEIVGIAGLAGCGKGSVGRVIFGLEALSTGRVAVNGADVSALTIRDRLGRGICYFPSDRAVEGLAMNRSIRENTSIAALNLPSISRAGLLRMNAERELAAGCVKQLRLSTRQIEAAVQTLSGGNRQKVLLARGLMNDISLFIFDEPTVGIDVGAKAEIYQWIGELAVRGCAVLLISSDLHEVINMSSIVHVMHEGRFVGAFGGPQKTEENILASFFGAPLPQHAPVG
jgi:ribose transport system ATP-binding protein